ncbi:MAG: hypothetical protein CSA11_10235 [Chloroflexi bacterium]|nr:MAG: hypothetical protein CSA11_10235 [Chloroflexota bacterium]
MRRITKDKGLKLLFAVRPSLLPVLIELQQQPIVTDFLNQANRLLLSPSLLWGNELLLYLLSVSSKPM